MFPAYKGDEGKLLLFDPTIIHGYDQSELLLGAMVKEHGNSDAKYTWYKDGEMLASGSFNSIICIKSAGNYSIMVECGSDLEISEIVQVVEMLQMPNSPTKLKDTCSKSDFAVAEVSKTDIVFSGIEIGEGAFGKVMKGKWAGSTVAIKASKYSAADGNIFRQRRCLSPAGIRLWHQHG